MVTWVKLVLVPQLLTCALVLCSHLSGSCSPTVVCIVNKSTGITAESHLLGSIYLQESWIRENCSVWPQIDWPSWTPRANHLKGLTDYCLPFYNLYN